jgi:hypothetical protein
VPPARDGTIRYTAFLIKGVLPMLSDKLIRTLVVAAIAIFALAGPVQIDTGLLGTDTTVIGPAVAEACKDPCPDDICEHECYEICHYNGTACFDADNKEENHE